MTRKPEHHERMKHRILSSLAVLLLAPAWAGAQAFPHGSSTEGPNYRFGLEIFSSPSSLGSQRYGFRASYALNPKWTVEGSFSFGDDDSESFTGFRHFEEYFLDFSMRRKIIRNRRLDFFAFGGVGTFRWKQDFRINPETWPFDLIPPPETIDEESLTLNLGLGLEVNVGRRFFFRSDLRHHATDLDNLDLFLTQGGQLSLGLGLKL